MKLTYKERRRAKEKLLPHKFTRSDWYATIRYFGHRCAYCGIKFSKKNPATREHVIPICKNGPTVKWNVVSACGKCNSSKNGYTMETWYRSQSFFTEERLAKIYRWAAENYQYDIFDEEVFA
jgi:5-methylcytosine-specific restriction endonuclease McrA